MESNDTTKIMSQNVRRLNNVMKRKVVFKKQPCRIVLLSETHCSLELKNCNRAKSNGYSLFSSHGSSYVQNVDIIFKNLTGMGKQKVLVDNCGHVLILKIKRSYHNFYVVNINASNPTEDRKTFFERLRNIISVHCEDSNIIAGDYYCS